MAEEEADSWVIFYGDGQKEVLSFDIECLPGLSFLLAGEAKKRKIRIRLNEAVDYEIV